MDHSGGPVSMAVPRPGSNTKQAPILTAPKPTTKPPVIHWPTTLQLHFTLQVYTKGHNINRKGRRLVSWGLSLIFDYMYNKYGPLHYLYICRQQKLYDYWESCWPAEVECHPKLWTTLLSKWTLIHQSPVENTLSVPEHMPDSTENA